MNYDEIIERGIKRTVISFEPFLRREDVRGLTDAQVGRKFGLATQTVEKDFLIVGDHGSESPLEDDDDIGLYHSMNDENDNVYMVTSATFFSLIPHFEIGGK